MRGIWRVGAMLAAILVGAALATACSGSGTASAGAGGYACDCPAPQMQIVKCEPRTLPTGFVLLVAEAKFPGKTWQELVTVRAAAQEDGRDFAGPRDVQLRDGSVTVDCGTPDAPSFASAVFVGP